jgi:hypothetical protein
MDAQREVLDPWLGRAQYKQSDGRVTFNYRFASEDPTPVPLRLKVEINTRAHADPVRHPRQRSGSLTPPYLSADTLRQHFG